MVDPFYDKKEAAKLAAQEAALAAPKLPVRSSPFTSNVSTMDVALASTSSAPDAAMGTLFVPSITCRCFFFLRYVHFLGFWISLLWFFISLCEKKKLHSCLPFPLFTQVHDESRNQNYFCYLNEHFVAPSSVLISLYSWKRVERERDVESPDLFMDQSSFLTLELEFEKS